MAIMKSSAHTDDGNLPFVNPGSIVRTIWGNADAVLIVFAGSAAEFALNRAVDWLFYTGRLPNDPLARLFSTAGYARDIVFSDRAGATRALSRIRSIHSAVEQRRDAKIPDWAHRDVLYMLIDYSERAFELIARPLTPGEKNELYDVFHRVGRGLGIPDLPADYDAWRLDRLRHLHRDLVHGSATTRLIAAYESHLGRWRYWLLRRVQSVIAPDHVRELLLLGSGEWLRPLVRIYPMLVRAGMRNLVHRTLMPAELLAQVRALDVGTAASEPADVPRPARRCPFHAWTKRTDPSVTGAT